MKFYNVLKPEGSPIHNSELSISVVLESTGFADYVTDGVIPAGTIVGSATVDALIKDDVTAKVVDANIVNGTGTVQASGILMSDVEFDGTEDVVAGVMIAGYYYTDAVADANANALEATAVAKLESIGVKSIGAVTLYQ